MHGRGVPSHDERAPWSLNKTAVDRWMKNAKPGDELVYARGLTPQGSDGVEELRRLHDVGAVTFKRRKLGDCDYSYMAERLNGGRPPAGAQKLGAAARAADDADEIARLMAMLRRKAARRELCPTNREIGVEIGEQLGCDPLPPERVSYLLRKQISSGRITVEAIANGRRVVTIVATGKRTARL
jgi:hypothetical protein